MEFVLRRVRGQTPNPNPIFGSIEKHFGVNKKFVQNQYFFLTIFQNFPNFQIIIFFLASINPCKESEICINFMGWHQIVYP